VGDAFFLVLGLASGQQAHRQGWAKFTAVPVGLFGSTAGEVENPP